MNLILVKSANSTVRTIPRKDGTKIQFNEQTAALECGDEFPQPFKITLDDDQKPYAPGYYFIDPASFKVNQYGSLEVGRRVKLSPMPGQAAPLASASK